MPTAPPRPSPSRCVGRRSSRPRSERSASDRARSCSTGRTWGTTSAGPPRSRRGRSSAGAGSSSPASATSSTGFIKDPTAQPPAAGPVGIAVTLADIFTESGVIMTLYVAAILSVNLGVVNILPFPPLDGGRMLVLGIKRVFGSRVSLRAERLTYAVGFVVLMAFILWVTGFDLVRLGSPP